MPERQNILRETYINIKRQARDENIKEAPTNKLTNVSKNKLGMSSKYAGKPRDSITKNVGIYLI